MTTTALLARTDVPAWTVIRRAAAAEWTRLWTLRSTWYALLAGTALMLFIGTVTSSEQAQGPAAEPIWHAAQTAIVPGQFVFLLIVLLATTGEYSTGAMRSTLQWVPRRGVVLATRLLVPVGFATSCAVIAAAATDLAAWGLLGDAAEVLAGDVVTSLGRIALVVAFDGVLAVGIGLFLRNTAGALATLFLLIFVLPIALGNSGVQWLITISDHLPGRAIVSTIVIEEIELAASEIAAVMIGWSVAVVLAGGWSLIRRDTT